MKFNFINFIKPFLLCALVGFVIDLIFNTHFFSPLGMFVGAYLGSEGRNKKT